jgi:hypothetical protein
VTVERANWLAEDAARERGFYWVKHTHDSEWQVCEWHGVLLPGQWAFPGEEIGYGSHELFAINERPLTPPKA